MARSSYIYNVFVDETWVASFTVLHELVSWLNGVRDPAVCTVVERCRDGRPECGSVAMNVGELLARTPRESV